MKDFMSSEQLNKLQSAVTRTTAAIGVKTSVFVGSAKVKTHIGTIEKEIKSLAAVLGELVYEDWEKGEPAPEHVSRLCRQIKDKHDNIKELEAEIDRLERQESEVLGAKKAGETKKNPEHVCVFCPNCKAEFTAQINFCRECGAKMDA